MRFIISSRFRVHRGHSVQNPDFRVLSGFGYPIPIAKKQSDSMGMSVRLDVRSGRMQVKHKRHAETRQPPQQMRSETGSALTVFGRETAEQVTTMLFGDQAEHLVLRLK